MSAHRSGIVALVGRPNVGKSTLLNTLVGTKIAIVTPVPGTTRNVIRGVLTRDDLQLIFVDTPGHAKPRSLLARRLNELVRETWRSVEVICVVVDAAAGIGPGDRLLVDSLGGIGTPVICVVNKIDRLTRDGLIPILEEVADLGELAEIVPLSATTGENVERLVEVLASYAEPGPQLFPDGMITDQPERQLVAEVIREKFIVRVLEEVPHSIAVVVEEMAYEEPPRADAPGLTRIHAEIHVERPSQKGIVIGKGGGLLREANTEARRELESLLGTKVYLDVYVRVAADWQSDPKRLERFGY